MQNYIITTAASSSPAPVSFIRRITTSGWPSAKPLHKPPTVGALRHASTWYGAESSTIVRRIIPMNAMFILKADWSKLTANARPTPLLQRHGTLCANCPFSLSMDYAWSALGSNQPSDDGAARHSLWQNLMVRWKSGRFSLTASIVGQQFLNHAPSETAAQNFSRFTPAVLADWQPFSRSFLSFRAFYKEMYRPPTFTENYYYHYGSTRLRPERTRQMGVGTTLRSQKGDAELTVDAYHNTVHDKITAVPVNLYLWRMTNTGLADIWGTDVALHVRRNFSGNWLLTLAGRYTFQQVEDRTTRGSSTYGRQLAYTPRHSGGASLACETPWLGGTVYVNAAESGSPYRHTPKAPA